MTTARLAGSSWTMRSERDGTSRGYGTLLTPDVSPERAVGGILRFSPRGGVRLELLDSIRADMSDRLIGDLGEEVDVILGATHGGKEVTLVRCWALHSSSSAPWVVPRVVYRVDVAYVGAHLVEESDSAFTTATLTARRASPASFRSF